MRCCRAARKDNPRYNPGWRSCETVDADWSNSFVACPRNTALAGFEVDGALEACRIEKTDRRGKELGYYMDSRCSSGLLSSLKKLVCCEAAEEYSAPGADEEVDTTTPLNCGAD